MKQEKENRLEMMREQNSQTDLGVSKGCCMFIDNDNYGGYSDWSGGSW